MKIKLYIVLAFSFLLLSARAQTFPVDTLTYKGNVNKYINIVLLGDGFTATQQDSFIHMAKKLSTYFLGQQPWSHYKNYCNVFAIKVVSNDAGVKHPNTASDCSTDPFPTTNPDNYFGSTFDSYGIHRLVVANNGSKVAAVLSANLPQYDVVLIVANSTHYGGSGGYFAVATVNGASNEIASHETGHSFALLADEYWAGAQYAMEKPNMTQESDPLKIKWKNWLTSGTKVGINTYPGYAWYHPSTACKMQYLGDSFCRVCGQAIIEEIHAKVNPIETYSPDSLHITTSAQHIRFKLSNINPAPNTLKISWKLDGNAINTKADSLILDQGSLSKGDHHLIAFVSDTTFLVRDSAHTAQYTSIVSWTISKTSSGIDTRSASDYVSYSIYPNPASETIHYHIKSEKASEITASVYAIDGRLISQEPLQKSIGGDFDRSINIRNLPAGTYILKLDINGAEASRTFFKK
jgi:hypothetical protein